MSFVCKFFSGAAATNISPEGCWSVTLPLLKSTLSRILEASSSDERTQGRIGVDARCSTGSWSSKKAPWGRGGWGVSHSVPRLGRGLHHSRSHTHPSPLPLPHSHTTLRNPPPGGKQSTHPPIRTSSFCSAHFYCII